MQSIHACAVQTHFSVFAFFLDKGSLETLKWVNFGVIFRQSSDFSLKKGVPKTASKKDAHSVSNELLLTCQEAPGEAPSRAHCTDKKQLFEQQLKHCLRFSQKKVNWAQNRCRKLTGLLTCCKKLNGLLEIVDCWKLEQVVTQKVSKTNVPFQRPPIWHALGQGPANLLPC